MYLELKKRLEARLHAVLHAKYDLQLETLRLETPPDLQFGELATPVAFELARKLAEARKKDGVLLLLSMEPRRNKGPDLVKPERGGND